MLSFLKRAAPWFIAGAIFIGGYQLGHRTADNSWKEVVHNEYIKKQAATQATQQAVNEISKRHQDDLAALEGSTDRIIDDLRNDGKRLRVKLKSTERQLTDNGGCLPDARAELDDEFAKRLIRVTQEGDLWIKSLQDTIREMKKEGK